MSGSADKSAKNKKGDIKMAQFCTNCGAQMDDNATVCGNCGTALAAPAGGVNANAAVNAVNDIKKKVPTKLIAPIAGGVVALILLIVIISAVASNSGVKGTIKDYYNGRAKGDFKKAANSLYLFNDKDLIDDQIDLMEDMKEDILDYYEDEFGKNAKVKKVEIVKEKKLDKDSNKYEEFIEYLENKADFYDVDFKEKDIKAVKIVDFKVTIAGKDDEDTNKYKDVYFVKTSDGWQKVDL